MDEWTEPHIAAAKGCAFQIFPGIGCRKSGVTAEKPSAFPAWRQDGTRCVCAQCPWEVLKILPHTLQWPLRIHAAHKGLTVLSAKSKQKKVKYHIGNVTTQSFPHCNCVDLVKKFNGTEDLFSDWSFEWESPSKQFRLSLFTFLNYQTKIFPGKDFCEGPWGAWLLIWHYAHHPLSS